MKNDELSTIDTALTINAIPSSRRAVSQDTTFARASTFHVCVLVIIMPPCYSVASPSPSPPFSLLTGSPRSRGEYSTTELQGFDHPQRHSTTRKMVTGIHITICLMFQNPGQSRSWFQNTKQSSSPHGTMICHPPASPLHTRLIVKLSPPFFTQACSCSLLLMRG